MIKVPGDDCGSQMTMATKTLFGAMGRLLWTRAHVSQRIRWKLDQAQILRARPRPVLMHMACGISLSSRRVQPHVTQAMNLSRARRCVLLTGAASVLSSVLRKLRGLYGNICERGAGGRNHAPNGRVSRREMFGDCPGSKPESADAGRSESATIVFAPQDSMV